MAARTKIGAAFLAGVVAATLGAVPVVAMAQAQAAPREYAIQSQDLGEALREFALKSGQDVVFDPALVRGKRSAGLSGRHTAEAGLRILLAGTGLHLRRTNSGFAIAPAAASAGQSSTAETDAASTVAESGNADTTVIDAVVVTGSRLSAEGATPVTTFSAEKIEQLGVASVADVLNYLPQRSLSFSDQTNFAGAQSIQLRGLGLGTTLVLINGRRTVTSSLQGARAFFDVNNIPLPAVERIEILANSASAVYGADAVAGVVNVILKDAIERPVFDVYYGFTPDGGSDEKRASLSFGHSSGRFRSGVTFDYFERTPLLGAERERTADQDFRRFGGVDARSLNANPGTVFSSTGEPLPGLTSTFAAVPVGSTGVGLTPADFLATQGTRNLESTNQYASITPEARRASAVAFATFDLTEQTTAFAEFMYTDRKDTRLLSPPALNNVLVPASNAFNPFGVPVLVNYLVTGIGLREDQSESQSYRVVAGFKGSLRSWNWEVSGLLTHDEGSDQITNQIDVPRRTAALASSDPATALNPFQDGPGGSQELLNSLIAAPVLDTFGSAAKQISGFVSRSLFTLPGGAVEVVFGGEARTEEIDFNSRSGGIFLSADRGTQAVFGEVRIPLIAPAMDVPLLQRLAVTAAARYDRYDDFGETFNPQFGLEWVVNRNLLLRASYGTSFRPPTLFELYQPQTFQAGFQTIVDPRRNNEQYLVDLRSGGNTELEPEDAKTFSAGLVFSPQRWSGFSASVDYWRIEQDLRVQRFTPDIVVNNESTFPERVIRAAPTAQDLAAGLPGRILQVDSTSANFGGVETDGFDLKADYRIETGFGTFLPSLSATYVKSFKAATLPGQPAIERAGRAGTISVGGSIPEWRATGSLAWNWRGLQLSTTGRYIDSYRDVNSFDVETGRKVDSQFIIDVQAGLTFGQGLGPSSEWLDGASVRIGAFNLFDKAPPFSEVSATAGYDASQADLRQRFVYVKFSKPF